MSIKMFNDLSENELQTAIGILSDASTLVAHGSCCDVMARDRHGRSVLPEDPAAEVWCLYGALKRAWDDYRFREKVDDAEAFALFDTLEAELQRTVTIRTGKVDMTIVDYNDRAIYGDVIGAIKEAVYLGKVDLAVKKGYGQHPKYWPQSLQ